LRGWDSGTRLRSLADRRTASGRSNNGPSLTDKDAPARAATHRCKYIPWRQLMRRGLNLDLETCPATPTRRIACRHGEAPVCPEAQNPAAKGLGSRRDPAVFAPGLAFQTTESQGRPRTKHGPEGV
jgi:hypothetical protein